MWRGGFTGAFSADQALAYHDPQWVLHPFYPILVLTVAGAGAADADAGAADADADAERLTPHLGATGPVGSSR
jgi:hypothetical protein